jgi:hypothetical protein
MTFMSQQILINGGLRRSAADGMYGHLNTKNKEKIDSLVSEVCINKIFNLLFFLQYKKIDHAKM